MVKGQKLGIVTRIKSKKNLGSYFTSWLKTEVYQEFHKPLQLLQSGGQIGDISPYLLDQR